MIHLDSSSLWRLQKEEGTRSVSLCFTEHLVTSKHLFVRTYFYTKCFKANLAVSRMSPDYNNVPEKGKSLWYVQYTISMSFTTHNHPYKCMETFKNSMCYRRLLAQNILYSIILYSPSHWESMFKTRGAKGQGGKQTGAKSSCLAPWSLHPGGERRGRQSCVHVPTRMQELSVNAKAEIKH